MAVGKGFSSWAEELRALADAGEDEDEEGEGEGRLALALDEAASTFLVALPGTQRWGCRGVARGPAGERQGPAPSTATPVGCGAEYARRPCPAWPLTRLTA